MKKTVFIIMVIGLAVYLTGCGKKHSADELMQEPVSMDALNTMSTETNAPVVNEVKPAVEQPMVGGEALPPQGPYKPSVTEVQSSLKNAGFYTGNVDGKAGPKTKKAIEAFQKANGLKVDGKVGPKTWSLLGKYLNAVPVVDASAPNTNM